MLIRRTTVQEIPTPITTFTNTIFVLPSVLPDEPTAPAPVAGNVNDEYYKDINPLFKLIIPKKKPEIIASGHGKSFTFSQRGNTCGSDTLFTILLQADGLKTLFDVDKKYVPKNEDERKSLSYLPPRLLTLYWATERYKQMKELEASEELKNKGPRRRYSINEAMKEKLGYSRAEQIRTSIGTCTKQGITTSEAFKEATEIIKSMNAPVGVYYGYESLVSVNRDNIKAIYVTGTLVDETKLGHVIAFLKKDNIWWISDNEVGYLHKIKNNTFIDTLITYILKPEIKNKDQLVFTFHDFKMGDKNVFTDTDLLYQFKIPTQQIKYPELEIKQPIRKTYNVRAERLLVFVTPPPV
jgi:hypothetical protein